VPRVRLVPPVLVALALAAAAPAGAWAQFPEGPLPGLSGEPTRTETAPPPGGGNSSEPPGGGDGSGQADGGRSSGSPDAGSPSGDGRDSPAPTQPDQEGAPTREGELPNTGSESALLALCGASLLLTGSGLRLRTDVPVR